MRPELGRTQYLGVWVSGVFREGCGTECVLLRRSGLDFEGDGVTVGVVQAEDLGDLVGEGAW